MTAHVHGGLFFGVMVLLWMLVWGALINLAVMFYNKYPAVQALSLMH